MKAYKSILVADDDPNDIFFLSTALSSIGCKLDLRVFYDGKELIDLLSSSKRLEIAPVCLFLDLKMPCLDGFDVLEWLQLSHEWRDLPVIVITSSFDIGDQNRAFRLGARDYLVKPCNVRDLPSQLRAVRQRHFPNVLMPAKTTIPPPPTQP